MSTENETPKTDGAESLSTARLGVWFRRAVLWATGRDLLEPKIKLPKDYFKTHYKTPFAIQPPHEPRWEMTLSGDAYMRFSLPVGPNVLHRLAQRFALGIRWRMLPKTPNY